MSGPSETGSRWLTAVETIVGFTALLWLVELLDVVLANRLDSYGIRPREDDGLVGIAVAPLLHGSWEHLASNTGPLLVLGFLLLLSGLRYWAQATATVWLVAGIGVWATGGSHSIHLGASVLVFGWLTCLLVQGFLSARLGQIALSLLVLMAYGGLLLGVLPNQPGISWQGHLFGAVGGVLAAFLLTRRRNS